MEGNIFPIEKLPIEILSEILLYCRLNNVEIVNKHFLMVTRITIKNIYNQIKQGVASLEPHKFILRKSHFEHLCADLILPDNYKTMTKINIGPNIIPLKDHNLWWKYFWFKGIKVFVGYSRYPIKFIPFNNYYV